MEDFMDVLKDLAPDLVAAVATAAATCLTADVTGKIQDKNTCKRIAALTEEEQQDQELVSKIVKGEARKRKILDAGLFVAEAVGIGAAKAYICDTYDSSESTSDSEE